MMILLSRFKHQFRSTTQSIQKALRQSRSKRVAILINIHSFHSTFCNKLNQFACCCSSHWSADLSVRTVSVNLRRKWKCSEHISFPFAMQFCLLLIILFTNTLATEKIPCMKITATIHYFNRYFHWNQVLVIKIQFSNWNRMFFWINISGLHIRYI